MVYMIYVIFSGLALEAKFSKLMDGITLAGMTLKINSQWISAYGKAFIIHRSFFKYFPPTF